MVRLTAQVTRLLEWTLVACLSIMGVLLLVNVALRYGFNSGLASTEELSRLLFVWMIFLGAILASRQHAHVGFTGLLARLSELWRRRVVACTGLLMLGVSAMFIQGGWAQMQVNWDNSYPVLGIPYASLYAVAVVFGVGLAISVAFNLWDNLTQPHRRAELSLISAQAEPGDATFPRPSADKVDPS